MEAARCTFSYVVGVRFYKVEHFRVLLFVQSEPRAAPFLGALERFDSICIHFRRHPIWKR